ncbi:MAG: ABC transporter substrate-binding protein [Chlamydiae bacterium]|nr:ABC transporter substrate-binding protein [Chlamydiota bacterium]
MVFLGMNMFQIVKNLLLSVLIFITLGCSRESRADRERSESSTKKITVLSTIAMIDDIVARIGKDRINSNCLISGEIDPHSYELVKGDDEKISSADVVFFNGLNLEHGASLCYKLQKHKRSIALGDYIYEKYPDYILKTDNSLDPHIWMDISLWVNIIDPITQQLSQIDPEGSAFYQTNAAELKKTMLVAHDRVFNHLQAVSESKRYLVTSHDAFGYFTRSYLATEEERLKGTWKKRFAAPEGLAPDGQLSVKDIQNIIDHLLKYNISVVFAESNVSQDSLKKIVSSSKEKKHNVNFSSKVLYGDAMGSYNDPVNSYLEMIEKNASSLINEWQK